MADKNSQVAAQSEAAVQRPQVAPDKQFGAKVKELAIKQCQQMFGTEEGQQAAQRITMSIMGAMQASRDPSSFYTVTDMSLYNCIAVSAQTKLLPGGPNPAVYLVPQSPRRGEPAELQWRITHRGLAILSHRAGFALRAAAVHVDDELACSMGEVTNHVADPDRYPSTLKELRGVIVVVRDIAHRDDIIRSWVPCSVIMARQAVSRDDSVWGKWPIEMAMKTAIKYVFARGALPLDSAEMSHAMTADDQGAYVTEVAPAQPPQAALPPPIDFAASPASLPHPPDQAEGGAE